MFAKTICRLALGVGISVLSLNAAYAAIFPVYTTTMNSGQGPSPVVFGTHIFQFYGSDFTFGNAGPPASISTNWLYELPGGDGTAPYMMNSYDISTSPTTFVAGSLSCCAPSAVVMFGVHADNPSDPFNVATDHLDMMVSSAFAATAVGKNFSTVFANSIASDGITEADLINDIIAHYQYVNDQSALNSALNQEIQFVSDNGSNIGFSFPGTYDVIQFSDGTATGYGVASILDTSEPIPEPATWAMLPVGLFAVGFTMRGRKIAPGGAMG